MTENMPSQRFAPFEDLAARLTHAIDSSGDGSHDFSHLERVWENTRRIQSAEGGDLELLAASVLLHDCVYVPKNSPDRSRASQLAAQRARAVLQQMNWPPERIDIVAGAIETHSYSANLEPRTIEARILQDADRLDAIGYTGIARCFYTAGRMGSQLYSPDDAEGRSRERNDSLYALDHFPKKLLLLSDGFKTETGQRLARSRHEVLEKFYRGMLEEVS